MNIFLAGATGVVGWRLVPLLRDEGDAVTGTTRSREKVVVLGTDLALHFTVATMVSQMPVTADELAIAGGLSGAALPVVKAVTQDFLGPVFS